MERPSTAAAAVKQPSPAPRPRRLESNGHEVHRLGAMATFGLNVRSIRQTVPFRDEGSVRLSMDGEVLLVEGSSKTLRADFSALIDAVKADEEKNRIPREHSNIPLRSDDDQVFGEVILTQVRLEIGESRPVFEYLSGYLIIDDEVL